MDKVLLTDQAVIQGVKNVLKGLGYEDVSYSVESGWNFGWSKGDWVLIHVDYRGKFRIRLYTERLSLEDAEAFGREFDMYVTALKKIKEYCPELIADTSY